MSPLPNPADPRDSLYGSTSHSRTRELSLSGRGKLLTQKGLKSFSSIGVGASDQQRYRARPQQHIYTFLKKCSRVVGQQSNP